MRPGILSLRYLTHIVAVLSCVPAVAATNGAARVSTDHVTVELVSETLTLKPGARAWLGLKLSHDSRWHTYWINPGDSGLSTRLEWHLPAGFKAYEAEWPAPRRIAYGDLYNFGYEGLVLLPIPIDVPTNAGPGAAELSVSARWLVCNDVCIPGKATLVMRIPVSNTEPKRNPTVATLFATARKARPTKVDAQGGITERGDRITIELRDVNLPRVELDAFPMAQKLFANTPFEITRNADTLTLTGQRSEYFEAAPENLVLIVVRTSPVKGAPVAWQFEIPWRAMERRPLARPPNSTSH